MVSWLIFPIPMKPVASMWVVIIILSLITVLVLTIIFGPLVTPPKSTDTTLTSQQSETVLIGDYSFTPSNLTIPVGSSVTWRNPSNSSLVNSVVSDALTNGTFHFASGDIRPGEDFTFKFDQAGVYPYHSGVQYFMKGVINVALPNGTVPGPNITAPAGNATVDIDNFQFSPSPLNISVGTTVTWNNLPGGGTVHTVTVIDGPEMFNSGYIQPGSSFSHTFTKPGTYNYTCNVHPFMFGQVIVT